MSFSIRHTLVPLVLFGALTAAAVHFVFLNALSAGAAEKLDAACSPNALYSVSYTGIESVDHGLCQAVTVFLVGLGSESATPIVQYFMASIPVGSLFVAVEASRNGGRGVPWYLAYPTMIGVFWQVASWAFALSIWSLLFVISGSAQRKSGRISQQDALAILIAFGVGAVIHFHLLYLANPYMTILWLGFPLIMGFSEYVTRKCFSSMTMRTANGHGTITVAYVLAFLTSAPFHLALVLPKLSIAEMVEFASAYELLSPKESLGTIMTHVIRWDLAIGSTAILLTSLWFARSFRQLIGMMVYVLVGSLLVGPATTLAGALIWREAKLNKQT